MTSPHRGGAQPSKPIRPQLLEVDPGSSFFIRFLGPYRYVGRHVKGKGDKRDDWFLCWGTELCKTEIHRLRFHAFYYAPVQVWQNREKVWRPFAIKLTENLEWKLRGQELRGQVWSVSKEDKKLRGREPLEGEFLESVDAGSLPDPFNMDAFLCHLFRVDELPPDGRSLLPDRPMSFDQPGSPPSRCLDEATAKAHVAIDRQAALETLRAGRAKMERNGASSNGVH